MTPATPAERARAYRERRASRDVTTRHDLPELAAAVAELAGEVRALVHELRAGYAPSTPAPAGRDANARHAAPRDVTNRHAPEPARARTRAGNGAAPLRGGAPLEESSRVTPIPIADGQLGVDEIIGPKPASYVPSPIGGRILETLAGVHSPQSTGGIADAIGEGPASTAYELVELQRAGKVRRVAAGTPKDRDGWQLGQLYAGPPIADDGGVTIACHAYREHATLGHRRDPATGIFRCYVCEPEGRPAIPGGPISGIGNQLPTR